MVGIIVALEEEIHGFKDHLKNCYIKEINNKKFYVFDILQELVCLSFSGVGKVNAASTALNMIISFNVDTIFSIGTAGTAKKELNALDIVIASGFIYNDVDLTAFGYKKHQIPNKPQIFQFDQKYINFAETVVANYTNKINIGVITTSESFIDKNNAEKFPNILNPEVIVFDMESTAIAQICYDNEVNFSCIKIISDNIYNDVANSEQWEKNTIAAQKLSIKIMFEMVYKIIFEQQNKTN